MRVLVDAMNVIGTRPDGWWRDRRGAMRELAERLRALAAERDERIVVVFDGRPFEDAPEPDDLLEVVFAPSADDGIVELVGDLTGAEAVVVVTSDAELGRRVRALGADVRSSGGFRRELDAFG